MSASSPLYLYDDAQARAFEPFALTRPVSELRAGTELLRRRWEIALGAPAVGALVAPHLADFTEDGAPAAARGAIPAGAIVAQSRFAPALGVPRRGGVANVWTNGGRVAALRLESAISADAFATGALALDTLRPATGSMVEIQGRWIDDVWQLVTHLLPMLREDIEAIGPSLACAPIEHATIIGPHAVYVERGATVEPLVVIDATNGPVAVMAGAGVRAFTRLVGPCYVGANAQILGDRVYGCAIGELSVIKGEISETIVLGHANKGHDGFVGHSILGRWVNLGAGTITSNLKNTYGSVSLWTPNGERDTGLVKLGTMFGDHVKTGIGTRFNTGSVVGAGSNVYGSAAIPRHVPAFSWGDGASLTEYKLEQFLHATERAMGRRQIALGDAMRRQLRAAHGLARGGTRG
jgi:UDP-N-acetylglucosamine diphosphorylase/glucosamine-1-phosphate N-acetyltransferase